MINNNNNNNDNNPQNQPHIVITGAEQVGKSSLVELLTGATGISSSGDKKRTRASLAYPTLHKFVIIDTPGNNPIDDVVSHNMWIAQAFCLHPVSLLIVCVEANTRLNIIIGQLLDQMQRFSDRFASILCVMVTKMDRIWLAEKDHETLNEEQIFEEINKRFKVKRVLFNGKGKDQLVMADEIMDMCRKANTALQINIKHEEFFSIFNIAGSDINVLRKSREIIDIYQGAVKEVSIELEKLDEAQKIDLVFQFQHFMVNQIPAMQSKLSKDCGFLLMGDNAAMEFGYIAHLGNQLKNILYNIRRMAFGYSAAHGANNLRKCPHCGLVWTKVTGCDGKTRCGNRTLGYTESENKVYQFATFSFSLFPIRIKYSGAKKFIGWINWLFPSRNPLGVGAGCGGEISWEHMVPFQTPEEIDSPLVTITTDDVRSLSDDLLRDYATYFRPDLHVVGYQVDRIAVAVPQ
eukprot:gene13854-16338_t